MFNFSAAPLTFLFILLNVFISLTALFIDRAQLDKLAFKPRMIREKKEYYRLISGGFVHAGLGHLAFNMITLYFFGPVLERMLGGVGFVLLYLGAELAAHGLTMVMQKDNPHYAAVGASGAISGVVFAYCLYQPFSKIYFFFIPVGIPALLFAFLYVGISVYAMQQAQRSGQSGGIAHEAHLGGALGGLLLTILLDPTAVSVFWGQVTRLF